MCPSTRCSLHTLEADGVLLGGLLDGAAGGGDQWKHGHEAQREEQRESNKRRETNTANAALLTTRRIDSQAQTGADRSVDLAHLGGWGVGGSSTVWA